MENNESYLDGNDAMDQQAILGCLNFNGENPQDAIQAFLVQKVAAQALIPLINSPRSLCFVCENLDACLGYAEEASAAHPETE